jgi:GTP-binding protein
MNSIVAIVGRPNVGKSTLFNRLVQRRDAIVDAVSGVTRDRHYGKSDWNGKEFSLIDTGGYVVGSDDAFEGEIRKQVELALEECDVIVFVVDVTEGITPMDTTVAKLLRKSKKPLFLAVNKVDNAMRAADAVGILQSGTRGLPHHFLHQRIGNRRVVGCFGGLTCPFLKSLMKTILLKQRNCRDLQL